MYDSSTSEETATLESRGDFISIPELASVARRSSRMWPFILPSVGFSVKDTSVLFTGSSSEFEYLLTTVPSSLSQRLVRRVLQCRFWTSRTVILNTSDKEHRGSTEEWWNTGKDKRQFVRSSVIVQHSSYRWSNGQG